MDKDQILALQRKLIAGGYLPQGSADGNYGPQTQLAEAKMEADSASTRRGDQEIEKAKAQAALAAAAGQRARDESAAQALQAQTEKERAGTAAARKREGEIEAYKNSPEGFWLGLTKNAFAPALGLGAGLGEAELPRYIERTRGNAKNVQLGKLAEQADAINWKDRDRAIARATAVAEEARNRGLLKTESGIKGFASRLGPGLVAVPALADALYQRFIGANDPRNTPANSDELLAFSNALGAGAFGSLGGATRYAFAGPAYTPDAASSAKILAAEKIANDLANRPTPPPARPPEVSAPLKGAGLASYEGVPAHVTQRIWSDLGGDSKIKTKGERLKQLPRVIDAASDEAVATAAHLAGYKDTTDPRGALKKFVSGALTETRPIKAIPRIGMVAGPIAAGTLAAGALSAGTSSPVRAEDFGYAPHEPALLPGLSRGEEALWRATDASNQMVKSAKEHPEYMVPYLGEVATARDIAQGAEAHPAWEKTPALTLKNAAAVGRQYAEDAKAVRNLEHAKAEDRRQRAELFAQHPELAPPKERPPIKEEEMFPGMAQKPPAEPYAGGGKVSPPAHARAMNTKLSAMQHELQRALSVAVKRLEKLEGKKGADRAAGKFHQEKENLIEDIWSLHELSQKIVGGKLPVHPQISKKELIGLARQHASNGTPAS